MDMSGRNNIFYTKGIRDAIKLDANRQKAYCFQKPEPLGNYDEPRAKTPPPPNSAETISSRDAVYKIKSVSEQQKELLKAREMINTFRLNELARDTQLPDDFTGFYVTKRKQK